VFHRYRIATPEIYPCGRNHVAWCFALSATHIQADLRLVADLLEDSGQPWIGITNRYGNCLIPRPELIRHRVRNAA
jgi:hypothetical protein